MANSSHPRQDDLADAGSSGSSRRFNIGGMPRAPWDLFVAALVIVAATVAASLYTTFALKAGLRGSEFDGAWVDVAAVALAGVSLLVLLPLIKAFGHCSEA